MTGLESGHSLPRNELGVRAPSGHTAARQARCPAEPARGVVGPLRTFEPGAADGRFITLADLGQADGMLQLQPA